MNKDLEIENIKKIFLDYTDLYEHSSRITLKINHTLRVADNCYDIAKSLGLNEDDIFLAYVIGICHDIGRFEQVKNFDSFDDKSCGIDHASYSNKVLFEENLIEKFGINSSLYPIIELAVYNHNKKSVPTNLDERELLFCNIIRDADKLDILYALATDNLETLFWYNDFDILSINDKVLDYFYQGVLVPYSCVKNNADQIVVFYGYISDLNFKISYLKIKESKVYETFTERLCKKFTSKEVHNQIKEINNYINKFVNTKI